MLFRSYTNGVSIRNDDPEHNEPDDYRHQLAESGSQWTVDTAGDPKITAMSLGRPMIAVTGDATNLYNNPYEKSTGVVRATRGLVWLQPDTLVVYDRADTRADGRFKRFWLQLPAEPHIDGHRSTMTTPKGQHLTVDTLLPAGAAVTAERGAGWAQRSAPRQGPTPARPPTTDPGVGRAR